MYKLRIMDIMTSSSVDGTGFRDVLFVNYCPHRCKGCHNEQSWYEENGRWVTVEEVYQKLTESDITNVTYSGGEPFCQAEALVELSKMLKAHTSKDIWAYTGYLYEDLLGDEKKRELLNYISVLVDGPFREDQTELNLRFKGSTNQRIIDVPQSLRQGRVVLFDG